jgi:hypothetical protein
MAADERRSTQIKPNCFSAFIGGHQRPMNDAFHGI